MSPRPLGQLCPFPAITVFMDCRTVAYSWDKSSTISQPLISSTFPRSVCLVSQGSTDLVPSFARAAVHLLAVTKRCSDSSSGPVRGRRCSNSWRYHNRPLAERTGNSSLGKQTLLPHLKLYLLRIFTREENKITLPERGVTRMDVGAQAWLSLFPQENNEHKN